MLGNLKTVGHNNIYHRWLTSKGCVFHTVHTLSPASHIETICLSFDAASFDAMQMRDFF